MSLPPDARRARAVLDGEVLTRLSPTLEAERANGDLSFRIKQARNLSRRWTQMNADGVCRFEDRA